jgi:hypothetical protein
MQVADVPGALQALHRRNFNKTHEKHTLFLREKNRQVAGDGTQPRSFASQGPIQVVTGSGRRCQTLMKA